MEDVDGNRYTDYDMGYGALFSGHCHPVVRDAVERHNWPSEDPRLEVQPVKVDVGVVCLLMGPVSERRPIARTLANELLKRADKLMYDAKGERASHAFTTRVRIDGGHLIEIPRDEAP